MSVHEQLRLLVARHGPGILHTGEDLRGVLDDFFAEGEVSTGQLNLLVDAVRLQAFDRLELLLEAGADPRSAVEAAGSALAQERSGDPRTAAWACAALGYAVGRVPENLVLAHLGTQQPGPPPQTGPPPQPAPPTRQPGPPAPTSHPPASAATSPARPPTGPPWQPVPPLAPPPGQPAPGSARPGRRGPLLAVLGSVLVLLLVTVVTVVVLLDGDERPRADTQSMQTDGSSDETDDTSDDDTDDGTDDGPQPGDEVPLADVAQTYVGLGSTLTADADGCVLEAPDPSVDEQVRCRYEHLRVRFTTYVDRAALDAARDERRQALEDLAPQISETSTGDDGTLVLASAEQTTWLYWDDTEQLQSGFVSAPTPRLSANAARNFLDQRGEASVSRPLPTPVAPFDAPQLWELAEPYVGDQVRNGRVRGCESNPNPDPDFPQEQRVQCTDGDFSVTFVTLADAEVQEAAREHFGGPADVRNTWDWLGESALDYPAAGHYYVTYTDQGTPILYWDDTAQHVYGFIVPPDGDHDRAAAYWVSGDAATS